MNFYFDLVKSFLQKYFLLIIMFLLSLTSLGFSLYNTYYLSNQYSKETVTLPDNHLEESSKEETKELESIPEEKYYVDIKGYVKKPGVYEVSKTSIVNDCLKLAGGLLKNADTTTINLSKPVSAAMVIYVPKNAAIPDNSNTSSDTSSATTNLKINLNTASKEELTKLSGIGEAKAQDIIDYRNTNGSFKTIEEIKNISGIGDALFAKIKDNITI